jgi:hypothetical protein
LRTPAPIHAAQAFAAAAIQKHGGHVILCLDDLGRREHTPEDFFSTVRRWCKRIHVDTQFEECRFSDILGGDNPVEVWPIVQKWLGITEQRMLEVLRISKILKAEDSNNLTLNILAERRPRRLLTPAMIWTCLAQVMARFSDRAIITLGGHDERSLWGAWRSWIVEGKTTVGHLYNPSLGVEPIHMSSANLGWSSRADITRSLEEDVRLSPNDWLHPNRMIPWCLSECVALSDFVLSGCSRLHQISVKPDSLPSTVIPDLARLLDDRLLSHS